MFLRDLARFLYLCGAAGGEEMPRKSLLPLFLVALLFSAVSTSGNLTTLLPNPIIFVKQVKVNHSGGAIQDLIGNFRGARPGVDQPVGGNLFLLTPDGQLKKLIPKNDIAVRDPEISADAKKYVEETFSDPQLKHFHCFPCIERPSGYF